MSNCTSCNEYKSLTGRYTFRNMVYLYRACPKCYPARTNVVNALNRLAAEIELGGKL